MRFQMVVILLLALSQNALARRGLSLYYRTPGATIGMDGKPVLVANLTARPVVLSWHCDFRGSMKYRQSFSIPPRGEVPVPSCGPDMLRWVGIGSDPAQFFQMSYFWGTYGVVGSPGSERVRHLSSDPASARNPLAK